MKNLGSGVILLAAAASFGCGGTPAVGTTTEGETPTPDAALSGGEGTTSVVGKNAFAQAAANLVGERRDAFFDGNSVFNRNWTTAPASTVATDGLGPTFNAISCSSCHFKDGRGRPPLAEDEKMQSMLIRLSVPGADEHGGPLGEPNYGGQLNPRGVLGVPGEGDAKLTVTLKKGKYDDGSSYELAVPTYTFVDLAYGDMAADVMFSPRTAPQMIGLGLLENISERDILKNADPDDEDHDGISGRPNHVWDVEHGEARLGRFGWKANQPSLAQQDAGAFLGDIGISSRLFPEQNCPESQADCLAAPTGGAPELGDALLDQVIYYSKVLAVPARRKLADAEALRGEQLFSELGCASCHTPTFTTGKDADFPELSQQTIHPYTDLLLHDLGDDLADNRPDFEATGNEWRTPPLWGVGLFNAVNDHTRYLHDGRARNLTEAVLWHGGEAEDAAAAFKASSKSDRDALVAFLASL